MCPSLPYITTLTRLTSWLPQALTASFAQIEEENIAGLALSNPA